MLITDPSSSMTSVQCIHDADDVMHQPSIAHVTQFVCYPPYLLSNKCIFNFSLFYFMFVNRIINYVFNYTHYSLHFVVLLVVVTMLLMWSLR